MCPIKEHRSYSEGAEVCLSFFVCLFSIAWFNLPFTKPLWLQLKDEFPGGRAGRDLGWEGLVIVWVGLEDVSLVVRKESGVEGWRVIWRGCYWGELVIDWMGGREREETDMVLSLLYRWWCRSQSGGPWKEDHVLRESWVSPFRCLTDVHVAQPGWHVGLQTWSLGHGFWLRTEIWDSAAYQWWL